MDEPTSGLDPVFRSEILDILHSLIQDENKSIFFSDLGDTLAVQLKQKYALGYHISQSISTKFAWEQKLGKRYGKIKLYFDNASPKNVSIRIDSIDLPTLPPFSHSRVLLDKGKHRVNIKYKKNNANIKPSMFYIEPRIDLYIYNFKSLNTYSIQPHRYKKK